VNKTKRT